MAVKWTKIYETSTTGDMPTNAANVWSQGINAPGGSVEFLQLRYDLTFAATPLATSEISALIDSIRVVLNGEVVHDFTAGFSANTADGPTQYGYMLNHIGGRCVEIPNAAAVATREGYITIPIGRVTPNSVNRYECIVNWSAAAAAIASGSMSWWIRYNDNMQTTTTVAPSTSYLSTAGAYEQVTVRVPQNVPGVVSGLLVLNDSEADELGTQGIRINAISDFGLEAGMLRSDNGDLLNGIQFNKGSTGTTQDFATAVNGAIFIPTYGLTGGDIVLAVDSTAGTTRRYIPVITNPVGQKASETVRQTQASPGNTAKAMLSGTLDLN